MGGVALVSVVKDFDCPKAGGGGNFVVVYLFVKDNGEVKYYPPW